MSSHERGKPGPPPPQLPGANHSARIVHQPPGSAGGAHHDQAARADTERGCALGAPELDLAGAARARPWTHGMQVMGAGGVVRCRDRLAPANHSVLYITITIFGPVQSGKGRAV